LLNNDVVGFKTLYCLFDCKLVLTMVLVIAHEERRTIELERIDPRESGMDIISSREHLFQFQE